MVLMGAKGKLEDANVIVAVGLEPHSFHYLFVQISKYVPIVSPVSF